MLRQIAELIDSTEDGSYIKTAFYGCVRDAERNIDEDAAYSWYDRARSYERDADAAKEGREQYRQLAEQYKEDAEQTARRAEQEKAELQTIINNLQGALKTANEYGLENWNNYRQKEDEADALRREVIELKAKLYDYMIKG